MGGIIYLNIFPILSNPTDWWIYLFVKYNNLQEFKKKKKKKKEDECLT